MHLLVYVSSAWTFPTRADIKSLLVKSRDANSRFGITGMLLYYEGTYMQVIEGPQDPLQQLWRNIQKDPAHHRVTKVFEDEISERVFPEWSMGFKYLDDEKTLPGYTPFLSQPDVVREYLDSPYEAKRLLASFAGSLR